MRFVFLYSLGEKYDKNQIGDHIRYLKKLHEEKKNLMNGPFLDDKLNRGIAIIEASDENEAKKLLAEDPCVKMQVLKAEIFKIKVFFDSFHPK